MSKTLLKRIFIFTTLAVLLGFVLPGAVTARPEDACNLLDDPTVRSLMSGAFETKLLVECGRAGEANLEGGDVVFGPTQTDVQVNDSLSDVGSSTTQSETSIAINQTTGTVCSAYNDSQEYSISGGSFSGFSSSTDGGATFVDHGAFPLDGGGGQSFGDPSLVWRDVDGYFYYASLHPSGLGLWRSTDDCQSFAHLAMIHTGFGDDKEIMAVDNNPASPYYGRLYVAWTDFAAGGWIYVTYSDNGTVWSAPVLVSSPAAVQGAWPAVDPNTGDVYVSWVRWNPYPTGPIDLEVVRSTNGGASFTPVTNPLTGAVNPRHATATSTCGRPALNANIRYLPSPQIVVGPDSALHVVYSYDPDGYNVGDVVNVYYRKSTDFGTTWGPEVQLNDDGTSTDQWFPTISVSPANTLVATWYDRRLDTANNFMFDYYKTESLDGGNTWLPNARVTDVSSSVPQLAPNFDPIVATCYHGDYDTQVQYNGFAYIQWSDDRNIQNAHPDPDVWFEKQAVLTQFGYLDGTVTDAVSGDPIENAKVEAVDGTSFFDFTNVAGYYLMIAQPDTYDVTASAFGYVPDTVNGVSVSDGMTTTVDFALDPATSYLVEGTVTDVNTGWPLYAKVDTNSPAGSVWTDPVTGYYSVTLPEGIPFNFEVSAWVAGYVPEMRVVGPLTSDTVENFALDVDNVSCIAPGYYQTWDYFEDFEAGLGNWTTSGLWNQEQEGDACGSLVAPFPSSDTAAYYGIDGVCTFNNGAANSGSLTQVSPVAIAGTNPFIQLWSIEETECGGDCFYDNRYVEISTNGGASWNLLGEGNTEGAWYIRSFDLTPYVGSNALFRFRFDTIDSIGNDYFGWMVDNIGVGEPGCVPSPGGLVVGNVYDNNTMDGLVGALVQSDEGEMFYTEPTPDDPNVDDGFYTLFASPGDHDFTASYDKYADDTEMVSVMDGDTVGQDFYLDAPWLLPNPDVFDVIVALGYTRTEMLSLDNMGGVDAYFEILEKDLGYVPPAVVPYNGPIELDADASSGPAPNTGEPAAIGAAPFVPLGSIGYSVNAAGGTFVNLDVDVPEVLNTIAGFAPAFFPGAGEYVGDYVYVIEGTSMHELDPATGVDMGITPVTPPGGSQSYTGMALDPTDGTVYLASCDIVSSILWTLDMDTGTATQIGTITNSPCMIGIAIDGNGDMWGHDIVNDSFMFIDKTTAAGTIIGPLGWNANFGQGAGWDAATDTLYLAAFNATTFQPELRIVDRTNGNNTLVGVLGQSVPGGLTQEPFLGLPIAVGVDVPWLSEDPISGTVPAMTPMDVEVTFDATIPEVPSEGEYLAELKVKVSSMYGNSPYGDLVIPVTMTVVTPYAPVVSFTVSSPVVMGFPATFTNTSDPGAPPADEFLWDFGDGVTMTAGLEDVTHVYTALGTYTVTLYAENVIGSDTATMVVDVVHPAHLQVAHLAPFAMDPGTAVTVTLNGTPALTDFAYGDSTAYIDLFPGMYDVAIYPAGSPTPAITATVDLMSGMHYTAIAIGDGVNQSLSLLALVDDVTAPAAGKFKLRIGHLAPFAAGGATADVRLDDGTVILDDVDFGDVAPYLELDAGTYDLKITTPDGATTLIDLAPLTFSDGQILSAFATGDGVNQALGAFGLPADQVGFFLPLEEGYMIFLPIINRND